MRSEPVGCGGQRDPGSRGLAACQHILPKLLCVPACSSAENLGINEISETSALESTCRPGVGEAKQSVAVDQ